MKIYTKTGDEGFTDRPDGRRVSKCDPRVEAVGVVDELDCNIGWVLQAADRAKHADVLSALAPVQAELFVIGTILAAGADSSSAVGFSAGSVDRIEQQIDKTMSALPSLSHFVIPGGCELTCRLHIARTVCRRAERAVVRTSEQEVEVPPAVLRYLNRLSDLLFALARSANAAEGHEERTWQSGSDK